MESAVSNSVRFPSWRADLIRHLRDVADAKVRFEWENKPYAHEVLHELKFLSDFVFDTITLREQPERLVGLVLYDDQELNALERFGRLLGGVLDRNEETDKAMLADPDWAKVMEAAHDALAALQQKERH